MTRTRVMLEMIKSSSVSSMLSLVIGPGVMNRCDELMSRVFLLYRRREMIMRLSGDLSNAAVKHSTRCTCWGKVQADCRQ